MKYRKEGHLLIDHRASPGLTPGQLFAAGQDPTLAVPEGKVLEAATQTCAHCNTPVIMNPNRIRPRSHCRKCDRYICDSPACHYECVPFEKKVDHVIEQAFRAEHGYSPLPSLLLRK